jgi:NAD(P)-dependent dehydrogenase (short-subunit alcohol dehydrogenase family)
MAADGARVIGVHFDTGTAREAAEALAADLRLQTDAHFFNANAASAASRGELVARIAALTDGAGLRVLLHSLAFGSLAPFIARADDDPTIDERQMRMTLDVMAHSLVYWTQDLHAAGLLPRGSHVLAMTSAGDQRVATAYGAVSAAKCALEAHVRQLAVELAPAGIAVNALRAGVTATPSLARIPGHEELLERARAGNPHGRLTEPADVADAVALLSAHPSSWITGNVIGVDGGELLAS